MLARLVRVTATVNLTASEFGLDSDQVKGDARGDTPNSIIRWMDERTH